MTDGTPRFDTEKAAALNGVYLQMFNHGLTAATLFCFLGFLEQRSGGLRGLNDFGGVRRVAPGFCGLMGISHSNPRTAKEKAPPGGQSLS